MWILKEHFDEKGCITSVNVELEHNETEEYTSSYLKKYYPDATFNFIYPTVPPPSLYHKVEDIHPHVNLVDVKKIKRF